MKKTSIILVALMMATASFGILSVDWSALAFQSGVEGHSEQFLTEDSATTAFLWELVYVSGGTIGNNPSDPVVTGTDRKDIDYGEGTQVLSSRYWDRDSGTTMTVTDVYHDKALDSLVFNTDYATIETGSTTYMIDGGDFNNENLGGGVYAAVFQYCTTAKGTDVYWTATPISAWYVSERNASAKDVSFTDEDPYTTPTKLTSIAGVPEPATMSLLGLGALAMVIRRKLRK